MEKFDCVAARRGMGFMQGIELEIPAGDVVAKCRENGVILISAGTNIIRFVPPLVIEKEHIDTMCDVLDKVFAAVQS